MKTYSINNTTMQSRFKLGQIRNISAPTPKMQGYYEGYYMEKSPLAKDYVKPDKSNFLVKLLKSMYETLVGIIKATKA